MRPLLPCVARCSLLPLCVAWSSALAARLVASRWSSAATPRPATAPPRRPCQQQLPDGSSLQRPCQPLRRSAPASNKPHPAEKSTPVWLAIWRIWARFANSQLQCATFRSTYLYMCPSPLLPSWTAAQTDANLSAHLHRLPTPPPYLRRMRLSLGLVRRCWM